MNKIEHLMQVLDLTEEEAKQVLADDDAIDHGAKLFELNTEQQKVAKKMRQADRKVSAYKFPKKERKANNAKRAIMDILTTAINENGGESLEITNVEREFIFTFENTKYKVVLSAPRK